MYSFSSKSELSSTSEHILDSMDTPHHHQQQQHHSNNNNNNNNNSKSINFIDNYMDNQTTTTTTTTHMHNHNFTLPSPLVISHKKQPHQSHQIVPAASSSSFSSSSASSISPSSSSASSASSASSSLLSINHSFHHSHHHSHPQMNNHNNSSSGNGGGFSPVTTITSSLSVHTPISSCSIDIQFGSSSSSSSSLLLSPSNVNNHHQSNHQSSPNSCQGVSSTPTPTTVKKKISYKRALKVEMMKTFGRFLGQEKHSKLVDSAIVSPPPPLPPSTTTTSLASTAANGSQYASCKSQQQNTFVFKRQPTMTSSTFNSSGGSCMTTTPCLPLVHFQCDELNDQKMMSPVFHLSQHVSQLKQAFQPQTLSSSTSSTSLDNNGNNSSSSSNSSNSTRIKNGSLIFSFASSSSDVFDVKEDLAQFKQHRMQANARRESFSNSPSMSSSDSTAAKPDGYELEFSQLSKLDEQMKRCGGVYLSGYSNSAKNRYKNVLPNESTRVKLNVKTTTTKSGSFFCSQPTVPTDYINANYIAIESSQQHFQQVPKPQPPVYIATQAPLPKTIGDFWRMVYEQDTRIIVMLTNELVDDESDMMQQVPSSSSCSPFDMAFNKNRVHKYWPSIGDCMPVDNGSYLLETVCESGFSDLIFREMYITPIVPNDSKTPTTASTRYSSMVDDHHGECVPDHVDDFGAADSNGYTTLMTQQRKIYFFQYTGWPDMGVPAHTDTILRMINKIEDIKERDASLANKPIVTHCSAGIGRTGTFCCIHIILSQYRQYLKWIKDHGVSITNSGDKFDFNVYNIVKQLKMQRIGMVQNKEQYIFCHTAILEAIQKVHQQQQIN